MTHKIKISEPAILLIINQLFDSAMSAEELYDTTRGNWLVAGERRDNAKYAFAVYKGIVQEVYEIQRWEPAVKRFEDDQTENRWRFHGIIADSMQHYVGGSVEDYFERGAQNPVRYVNC